MDDKENSVKCSLCDGVGYLVEDKIGRQILSERKRIGVSQREIAKECGISTATVSNIEKGYAKPRKPTVTVIKMALEKFDLQRS